MKKTIFATLGLGLASLTVLAVAAPSVLADATNPNATEAIGTTKATTDATVNFKAGNLSLYDVADSLNFGSDSVNNIWAAGFKSNEQTKIVSPTIEDFLGDSKNWSVSVGLGQWAKGTDGTDKGATTLNSSATLTFSNDNISREKIIADGSVSGLYTGNAGKYSANGTGEKGDNLISETSIEFDVAQGTLVESGSYTNTLTWSLEATPGNTGEALTTAP
jgi:hypothetical protein